MQLAGSFWDQNLWFRKTSNNGSSSWQRVIGADGAGNVAVGALTVDVALGVNGDVQLSGKHAFRANDSWLRLNQDGAFTSGTHTPHLFAPMSLNVGGAIAWDHDPGAGAAIFAGNIGVANNDPYSGGTYPDGWGGGLHTWDVVPEAAAGYTGTQQFPT